MIMSKKTRGHTKINSTCICCPTQFHFVNKLFCQQQQQKKTYMAPPNPWGPLSKYNLILHYVMKLSCELFWLSGS
jgi:hypothetical protein